MKKDINIGHQGFTLIEVLIAMVILAIGMLSLISMQVTGIKGNATANQISTASNFSADHIENIFDQDWTALDIQDDKAPSGVAGLNEKTVATADGSLLTPDGLYTVYWNVSDDTPMRDIKTIRVIIVRNDNSLNPVVINYVKSKQI